jgi:O-antigen/teichoic acid export membrane protein
VFLPLLWFAPQTLGGKTLLPADNLFQFAPWQSFASEQGVGVPHNALISDLILENYAWKSLIVEALRSGDPSGLLWSPRLFAGAPFLAAGQHSALYPLSVLFYLMPLWRAFGVFTWLQLGLAAAGMYGFGRVMGQRRPAATAAAIAFAFSGFMIVSVNFTMVIAAAAWLPWILAMIELALRRSAADASRRAGSPAPYVILGAVFLGVQVLAGHVEITYYVLMVSAFYGVWRLAGIWLRGRGDKAHENIPGCSGRSPDRARCGSVGDRPQPGEAIFRTDAHAGRDATADEKLTQRRQDAEAVRRTQQSFAPFAPLREASRVIFRTDAHAVGAATAHEKQAGWIRGFSRFGGRRQKPAEASRPERWAIFRTGGWLLVMVALGLALAAVQLIPLYELVSQNFREGSASLQQVRDWAWPTRQIITFLLPDAFGNPTHHAYLDIWSRQAVPVTQNALGEPLNTIDWGVKNYVEGGNYLGLLTLLLAAIGVLSACRQALRTIRRPAPGAAPEAPSPAGDAAGASRGAHHALGFAVLALLSLLFAFGTPLYAVLYYLAPGYSQLHSAFRWVFPYTLSMAALAGFGLDALLGGGLTPGLRRLARVLAGVSALAGLAGLAIVTLSIVVPGPFVALGSRLLLSSDLAQARGFASGEMAWSYEAVGLARFGVMALLAGIVLWWAVARQRHPVTLSPCHLVTLSPLWPLAVIALLSADLWLFGHSFNPAADPRLLDFKPPAIQWLQDHQEPEQPWRLTAFNAPGEKTLNPNSAMPFGLEDMRGYDSIIPRAYVSYVQRIQPQWDLLYNNISPIYTRLGDRPNYDALDNPLLDLLGVRYVVTTHTIPNAGYELVYDREVKIYENHDAFPRVFIAPQAALAANQQEALDRLQAADPRQVVVVEDVEGWARRADSVVPAERWLPASPQVREARISRRGLREVFVDVNVSDRGWLVFTDAYFDGWKAYLRPFGAQGEGVAATGQPVEQQLALYRADGVFRAVYIEKAGQWTVRFVYSPRSVLLGAYASFLAAVMLLLLAGWWAWRRFYHSKGGEVGTVAKNSAVQMAMSLLGKVIDFAFAMLRLRVLSPAGEGSYYFAITFYGVFEIVTRFGLGTLLTRDVACDRDRAGRYLINVAALRVGLWTLSLPIMALVGLAYHSRGKLPPDVAQAIVIFAAALFFANLADAISSVFNAFEAMEYPAALATATNVAKVALGALVLLPPFDLGFVGLAWVSLVVNAGQVVWLYVVMRRTVLPREPAGGRAEAHAGHGATGDETHQVPGTSEVPGTWWGISRAEGQGSVAPEPQGPAVRRPRLGLDWALQRHMLRESGPLMLNHLLASIFWRISVWLLQAFPGEAAVGIFSAGVKYLDGLNVIPAYFSLAIFPLMSRYAVAGKNSLAKAYRLAAQLLFIIALPIAVFVSFAAAPLIGILGGAAYLPDSAIALAIMIWSIPIGFINSVTQYVLIAANQQRFLTIAFLIGVSVTALANWFFVPRYGYLASAIIMIPAECALFAPFYWAVRRHVTIMPWVRLIGGPLLAAGLDAAAVWGLQRAGASLFAGLLVGAVAYLLALLALGVFRGDDYAVLRARLPLARYLVVQRLRRDR